MPVAMKDDRSRQPSTQSELAMRTQDTEATEQEPTVASLACHRKSPRPCFNQTLVDELAVIRQWRFLQFGTHDETNSIGYATAVSVIIGTPFLIETAEQAKKLPKIGEKIVVKIAEFLEKGYIQESRDILKTEKFRVLSLLSSVHGIGWKAANDLYNEGARTLDDLRELLPHRPSTLSYFKYLDDLSEKIPREEVDSIVKWIQHQLDKIQPGARLEACGGYRRGKSHSNDVDIIITWPHQDGLERGVLDKLVERLLRKRLVPNDGVLYHTMAGSERTIKDNRPADRLDALDKALVIFRLPAEANKRSKDKFRRVDLIVTRWPDFGCAVVGWTGSTQFERDLRRHAHRLNMKFDSGGIRERDTDRPIEALTEQDVFRVLQLPYIDPKLRNADP
ncbi:type-X family DNA polymerase [Rhodotorula paludigena]|uniref:type-X family DNA polymerase n=1 Tax=Rhodotorula paludigena TaxID=86838 RepID=UPI003172E180